MDTNNNSQISAPNNEWLSVDRNLIPLETDIIVRHKFGIEAIHYINHEWRYWYTGKIVDIHVLQTMTHFMIVK